MPFNFPSLKHAKSTQILRDSGNTNGEEANPRLSIATSRKAMQDFFKQAGVQMQKMPTKRPTFGRSKKARELPSKRASQVTMDVDDDVLFRVMGAPKKSSDGRIASERFYLKQRQRIDSQTAVLPAAVSPLSQLSSKQTPTKVLSAEEVLEMFVGAPHFSVVRQRNQYKPQVIFKGGDVEEASRYGRDISPFGHSSFGAATLCLAKTNEVSSQIAGTHGSVEVPSMLGLQGNDPGTVGFEHFLQIPISDSTINPDEPALLEKRKLLFSQPEHIGLKKLDLEVIISRLTELSTVHQARKENASAGEHSDQKTAEMHAELFETLLHAQDDGDADAPTSAGLAAQTKALLKVLDETELWHDFSLVEWRIRVGHLLWASEEHGTTLDEDREPSECDVLLLQIALASELLVRLDILETIFDKAAFPPVISPTEQDEIQKLRTSKVEWDLILAQQFLENLEVSANVRHESSKEENRKSFLSAITFFSSNESADDDTPTKPKLLPKNEGQQLAGLLYFAEAIRWPHAADVRSELEAKLNPPKKPRPVSVALSVYVTPPHSPRSFTTSPSNRNSYLGIQPRPGLSRMTTAQSMQLMPAATGNPESDTFEVGGWLSRSWLTGLVLPGEPASHFLISTLLENSLQAIDALGDAANLYGGFLYQGRMYWSKSCVAGRVLAATKGASDCMGWISVPGTVEGQNDGWLNLEVKELPKAAESRIKDTDGIMKDSDNLHGKTATTVTESDLTSLVDGPPVMGNEVRSHGLSFVTLSTMFELTRAPDSSRPPKHHGDSGVGAQSTSIANLTFSSPLNSKLAKLQVPLTYDVHFVSSYPCYPSNRQASPSKLGETLEPPHRSTLKSTTSTSSLVDNSEDLPPPPSHPLHIDFHFDIVPVATLLSAYGNDRAASGTSANDKPIAQGAEPQQQTDEVNVLDCRGTADLELLARAWCAKEGMDALIGKEGRTCLACCVREARALAIRIVIRT